MGRWFSACSLSWRRSRGEGGDALPVIDPEQPQTLWGALLALFGAGGGGAAVVRQIRSQAKFEQRVVALEGEVKTLAEVDKVHEDRFGKIETTLGVLEERSRTAIADRKEMRADQKEILSLLREK